MRRGGFSLPRSVADATRRFRLEADPMRGFMEERVESHHPNDPHKVPRTEVYMAYTTWAGLNGFQPMSAHRFYESFVAASVDAFDYPVMERTVRGTKVFMGMSIK